MLLFLLCWGVATGVMDAPMWAGWLGGVIVAYLAVPVRD
jgi:hypothetical protein